MLILSVACIYNGSDLVQLWIPHQSQLHLLCQQRLPKLLQQHRPVLDHHREGQPRGTENRLEIILQTNRRAQTCASCSWTLTRWRFSNRTPPPTNAPRTGLPSSLFVLWKTVKTVHSNFFFRFVVTGGAPVPIICGHNTGQHMYIGESGWSAKYLKVSVLALESRC